MYGGRTICLCMIVKNEAEVIERCLVSARPIIDYWVISDTGSEDNTCDLIRSALEGVPGELMERPWLGFAQNRNEVLEQARSKADYLLLLDADEELEINGSPAELDEPSYLMWRRMFPNDAAVPLLVRSDIRWWYERRVHEYLTSEDEYTPPILEELSVLHHGDGARGEDKLTQNLELLTEDLGDLAGDPRTTFYLGQTYRQLGNIATAIDCYRQRLELDGWEEETYYAHYQLGALLATIDWKVGLAELLAAWDRRPERAEAICEAAMICRLNEQWTLAYTLARRGLKIPLPEGEGLFVHRSVWEWGMKFEYAIACYWVGEHEDAITANDELLALENLPPEVAADCERNRAFSVDVLERTAAASSAGAA
jgi:glycosyltransferase involved in cell wall biosynthesis